MKYKIKLTSMPLMMVTFITISFIAFMAMTVSCLAADGDDMATALPVFPNWTAKSQPAVYTPDNLYEYIDGAAEVFLGYDFEKLVSITYENEHKKSFTVDIYHHSNDRNGFGIYSQEKPENGNFIEIGTQAYYEKGVLNFLKGKYYVKLSGYDLGEEDQEILTMVAKTVTDKLDGSGDFPVVLQCFPGQDKIANSERYIAQNFLGHSFMHSAFVADYQYNGKKVQVFIIETDSPSAVDEIITRYREFITKKGEAIEEKGTFIRFQDPYYRRSGKMNMKKSGNYLYGLFCEDDAMSEALIAAIEKNLKEHKLI